MIEPVATRPGPTVEASVVVIEDGRAASREDRLATEEPLEIRLRAGSERRTVAITMRTPGNDFELVAGFLHNEGVVTELADLRGMSYCLSDEVDPDQQYNIVNVELASAGLPALDRLERHFTTTSACGVCGKANLDALHLRGVRPLAGDVLVDAATIVALPEKLRAKQRVFETTGGLHAAALFDRSGSLVAVREDVGRHNALDKLIGWAILNRRPLGESLVLVSGRSSYEIVQKALAAGIPIVCSVSAPSSLAVDVAREFGVTLVGFLRGSRFNVYTHASRIRTRVEG
jgi:FdhD protein